MKADDITGVILAGGRSRRFGEDKADVLVDGFPMIEHVYRAASAITDRLFLSVRDPYAARTIAAPALADLYPGSGPLAGLHAGLEAAETPWVLLMACDMPFITSGVLRHIVDARRPDVAAVVARTPDGRKQPLCACYNICIRSLVEQQLLNDRLAMTELLKLISRVRFVDVPGEPLRNINVPSDL